MDGRLRGCIFAVSGRCSAWKPVSMWTKRSSHTMFSSTCPHASAWNMNWPQPAFDCPQSEYTWIHRSLVWRCASLLPSPSAFPWRSGIATALSNRNERGHSMTKGKNVYRVGLLSPVFASPSFQVDKRERDAHEQCHAKVELQLWLTGTIPGDLDHDQE